MNSEEHYFSRVDLNGEGEELAAAELRAMTAEIHSRYCCICGQTKLILQVFCSKCYWSLPIEVRSKLYRVAKHGDLDLFEQAKALLRIRAEIAELSR